MTQEDKDLLLKDLCARLLYKVIVEIESYGQETQKPWFGELSCKDLDCFLHDVAYKSIKPYLRPLSSMTEEEQKEFVKFHCVNICPIVITEKLTISNEAEMFNWLNKKMFDYRGLIPKGSAIEVTKNNNPYKD